MKLECTGLPPRQREAFLLAAQGCTEKMTAKAMCCSLSNVRSLRSTIFYKLHAQNITSAVAEGFRRGYLKYIPALLLCLGAILPAPAAQASDDDVMVRRVRARPSGRTARRIRSTDHIADASEMVNQDFIHFHGLNPVLVWDEALYLVYQ